MSTEYIVLVGTVGLTVAAAIVALGPKLFDDYQATRLMISGPLP